MPGEKLRGCPTTSLLSIAWQSTPCSSDYIKAKNCCMLQQLSGEAAGFRDAVISQMSSSVDLVFVYTRIILSSLFCLNFFFRSPNTDPNIAHIPPGNFTSFIGDKTKKASRVPFQLGNDFGVRSTWFKNIFVTK